MLGRSKDPQSILINISPDFVRYWPSQICRLWGPPPSQPLAGLFAQCQVPSACKWTFWVLCGTFCSDDSRPDDAMFQQARVALSQCGSSRGARRSSSALPSPSAADRLGNLCVCGGTPGDPRKAYKVSFEFCFLMSQRFRQHRLGRFSTPSWDDTTRRHRCLQAASRQTRLSYPGYERQSCS